MAYVGYGYRPSEDEFEEVLAEIGRTVDADMLDDPDFFSWSPEELTYMAIREQAYRICRYFEWTLEGGRIDV